MCQTVISTQHTDWVGNNRSACWTPPCFTVGDSVTIPSLCLKILDFTLVYFFVSLILYLCLALKSPVFLLSGDSSFFVHNNRWDIFSLSDLQVFSLRPQPLLLHPSTWFTLSSKLHGQWIELWTPDTKNGRWLLASVAVLLTGGVKCTVQHSPEQCGKELGAGWIEW